MYIGGHTAINGEDLPCYATRFTAGTYQFRRLNSPLGMLEGCCLQFLQRLESRGWTSRFLQRVISRDPGPRSLMSNRWVALCYVNRLIIRYVTSSSGRRCSRRHLRQIVFPPTADQAFLTSGKPDAKPYRRRRKTSAREL